MGLEDLGAENAYMRKVGGRDGRDRDKAEYQLRYL